MQALQALLLPYPHSTGRTCPFSVHKTETLYCIMWTGWYNNKQKCILNGHLERKPANGFAKRRQKGGDMQMPFSRNLRGGSSAPHFSLTSSHRGGICHETFRTTGFHHAGGPCHRNHSGDTTLETSTYIVKAFDFQCFYPHYRVYGDREFGIRRQLVKYIDVTVMFNLV